MKRELYYLIFAAFAMGFLVDQTFRNIAERDALWAVLNVIGAGFALKAINESMKKILP